MECKFTPVKHECGWSKRDAEIRGASKLKIIHDDAVTD